MHRASLHARVSLMDYQDHEETLSSATAVAAATVVTVVPTEARSIEMKVVHFGYGHVGAAKWSR